MKDLIVRDGIARQELNLLFVIDVSGSMEGEKIGAVKNIHCEVKEDDGHVTFLYKMKEGSMDRSYGVNVAKLAGLPDDLIERADELLFSLESRSNVEKTERKEVRREEKKDELREELKRLDPMTLSPLDALNYLIDLKKRIH